MIKNKEIEAMRAADKLGRDIYKQQLDNNQFDAKTAEYRATLLCELYATLVAIYDNDDDDDRDIKKVIRYACRSMNSTMNDLYDACRQEKRKA